MNRFLGCICALLVWTGGVAADQGGYGGGGNYNFDAKENSERELLQQATSLAIGNLAWESVNVSEIRKAGAQVKWTAKTRSNTYSCSQAAGQEAFCDHVASISPEGPARRNAAPAGAGERGPGAAAAAKPQIQRNMVSVLGRDRGYFYYVPAKYTRDGFNFVVYAIHDNGQTPQQFAEQSGWMKVADEHGFAVVFPEAERGTWATNSGGEDVYIKAVYDHAIGHLRAPDAAAAGARGEGGARGGGEGGAARGEGEAARGGEGAPARGGGQAAAGAGAGGGGGAQAGGERARQGIATWLPFHYVTGAGAGATVAQEFAMNHPGIFAALATLDGGAYAAAYAKGDEPAQGYFQNSRGGKNAQPVWNQLKKEVPLAAWLFTSGSPTPAETQQVEYWKRSNDVAATAQSRPIEGLDTRIYKSAANEYQEVRTTTLGDAAKYDQAIATAIWRGFFSKVARWTSFPNGYLGSLLSEAEVKQQFDVRTLTVDGATYTYYVKTPSSYRKGQSLPLVIAAGGGMFPAWIYLSQIKMHEVGEREGFITVYANGQRNQWDFRQPAGRDAKFIRAVIDDLIKTNGVNKSQVYMQGFSLGSGMSYMMGITHPQLFAAVSPNNGIGPMAPEVVSWVTNLKQKKPDLRIPMMMLYGDVDNASSTDGKLPARGVLRGAIDEMKKYNNISASDQVVKFDSPNTEPYDVLVLGGTTERKLADARYPDGRFVINSYLSDDRKPLPLFGFAWVTDLPHGADPRTAQIEWDFFKQWRRNANGSLTFTAR